MKATPRKFKIALQRITTSVDDGYTTLPGGWATFATEYAAIFYGSGKEQREAAQENAAQTATFEVLSNVHTRSLTPLHRIRYPIDDPDSDAWPTWDIQAVTDIGMNDGIRIVATKPAS